MSDQLCTQFMEALAFRHACKELDIEKKINQSNINLLIYLSLVTEKNRKSLSNVGQWLK